MSVSTPSRLGQINETGGDKALFLEMFSGLVLEAYDTRQLTDDRQTVRTIVSGKSAQFPLIWKTTAKYHTPGVELIGDEISHAGKTINIEQLLEADVFVDTLDEAMNHYEIRQEYAHQLGEALANAKDINTFRGIFKGAAGTHPIDLASTKYDGTQIQTADLSTTAALMKAAMYDIAQTFDEKDVPDTERFAALLPLAWYLLLEDGEFIHRDFAGEGSKAHATMPFAADIQVLKSNNIPTIDESGGIDNVPDHLEANFEEVIGVAWHKRGVGTVKLLDLTSEEGYDIRRQGTLLVSKYAIGQDFLRTEGCISLEDTSIA